MIRALPIWETALAKVSVWQGGRGILGKDMSMGPRVKHPGSRHCGTFSRWGVSVFLPVKWACPRDSLGNDQTFEIRGLHYSFFSKSVNFLNLDLKSYQKNKANSTSVSGLWEFGDISVGSTWHIGGTQRRLAAAPLLKAGPTAVLYLTSSKTAEECSPLCHVVSLPALLDPSIST